MSYDEEVAPHAGAWIETHPQQPSESELIMSRPTRARGLKHGDPAGRAGEKHVAPHAGAWIETAIS